MQKVQLKKWHLIDAKDMVLGKAAERAAVILRGKNKVEFVNNQDMGDFVVIINAAKAKLSGNKMLQKMHRNHSGYLGGLKEIPMGKYFSGHPDKVVYEAVKGMLPKNRLSSQIIKKLKVFNGEEHPYKGILNC